MFENLEKKKVQRLGPQDRLIHATDLSELNLTPEELDECCERFKRTFGKGESK